MEVSLFDCWSLFLGLDRWFSLLRHTRWVTRSVINQTKASVSLRRFGSRVVEVPTKYQSRDGSIVEGECGAP